MPSGKVIQERIEKMTSTQKTFFVTVLDSILAAASFVIANFAVGPFLNFKLLVEPKFLLSLGLVTIIQSLCFYFRGLYKGIWRYSSTHDLLRLIKGITLAVTLAAGFIYFYQGLTAATFKMFVIDWFILIVGLGGARFTYRIWRDSLPGIFKGEGTDRVIIVGAGSGGERLFRELKENKAHRKKVLAFVDDDLGKKNKLLHGVPVMGGVNDLPDILAETNVQQVYIAIPSATGEQIRKVYESCKGQSVSLKTLPSLGDFLKGKTEFSQLRDIGPEDLLGRQQVTLDTNSLGTMLTSRVIMVTGAGGSIGSEICMQVAKFSPSLLILFEQSEYCLYQLEKKLKESFPEVPIKVVIGDIRNEKRVDSILREYRPQVVFHAAAYKHVPMMEKNPKEAVETNVRGTLILASACQKFKVDRFVQISTDKAVNPTSVMGASKRVAEMVCQRLQSRSSDTKFMTVRFGNVLGSSGSVIPLFKEQIKRGGPITVTHPEVKRYFMSIPEASQLVLQAGAMGKGGEIFVLNMGTPIKILDLAKQMVSLAGLREGQDINIEFCGLRPGEKLFEELLCDDETTLPTTHSLVRVAKARFVPEDFDFNLQTLLDIPLESELSLYQQSIKTMVNDFRSGDEQNEDYLSRLALDSSEKRFH